MNKGQKLAVLSAVFTAGVIAANLMGAKIADFNLFYASVGLLVFPPAMLALDIVQEVEGKEKARQIVFGTLCAMGFVLLMTAIAVWLPSAPRDFYPAEYGKIFGVSLRIMIASILAFLIAELADIHVFRILKEKTGNKMLWLRANVSTLVSEFIDTAIFMTVAFYGITPKHDAVFLIGLIIPWWLLKCGYALLGTPLVYAGAAWLRKE
ncbi:MAG: queuosine precursor transporter [Candidatus Diapherotrites archaeon]|nr:queuosine precursor transporter [Candidatus Diapherotrites archaeon]